ncbi:MAG: 30S ribosomal protein S7 [Ignavibacteriae bacterium 37-53-5]|nr:MAG: 30S ribosomal protein S7 [Ignavibacteriae bacterium 37-53-5]
MRKKRSDRRQVFPDPKYHDVFLAKFVNNVMTSGNKHRARRILYDAFDIVEQRTKQNPLDVFRKALNNVQPIIEVRARRVGGATYQVPSEVRPERSLALGMRWLIRYARDRKDKSMSLKLAAEIIAAANGEGNAIKKREDTHKMAEANKAFAHYRW